MRSVPNPPNRQHRGMTLVEMMVAVALLVLMMTILVSVFASATGAIREHRAYAALDMELRRVDTVIRQDLRGITATMTPAGVDPARDARESRLGYFEYAENSFADLQGEDTDDTLRFTAQAPDGQPFTGRVWVRQTTPVAGNVTLKPITVTSQYAEIIYFLRNHNLYRRVLLIAPERQSSLGIGNIPNDPNLSGVGPTRFGFQSNLFQPLTSNPSIAFTLAGVNPIGSWLGLNDISARPSSYPAGLGVAVGSEPILSYVPQANTLTDLANRENRAFNPRFANDYVTLDVNGNVAAAVPDGIPDDANQDGVPDFYPTLYPNAYNVGLVNMSAGAITGRGAAANQVLGSGSPFDILAFPYIYPNSFSVPTVNTAQPAGRIHLVDTGSPPNALNHAPLLLGDSLPLPAARATWWGFPTWRETLSPYWLDPIKRINDPSGASYFSFTGVATADKPYSQSFGLRYLSDAPGPTGRWLLPPVITSQTDVPNDGTGSAYFNMPPDIVWEDDLLLSGVRSFDIKAYDPNATYYFTYNAAAGTYTRLPAGYYDLGYADNSAVFLQGNPSVIPGTNLLIGTRLHDLQTLGHEGRIPPLTTDSRSDAQWPLLLPNIGDDNTSVVRLRRVWDSWATAYSMANALPMNPVNGPYNGFPPVVPSYPAPYPVPLRGIQIQIRVVDPAKQRIKSLTIKQDFSDHL